MAANPNWSRWVYSSLAGDLYEAADTVPAIIEGVNDRTDEFMQSPERAEIRVNGPIATELSRDYWRLDVVANVVITVQGGQPYRIQDIAGQFQAAMDQAIAVKKYGVDETHLGCLSPSKVTITHYGQVDRTNKVLQATVDCSYHIYLSGE